MLACGRDLPYAGGLLTKAGRTAGTSTTAQPESQAAAGLSPICCKVLEFPLCLEFLHLVFSSALFREVQPFCNLSLTRTRVWIRRIDSDVCILLRKDKKKKKPTAFLNCTRFIISQKADHLDNISSEML